MPTENENPSYSSDDFDSIIGNNYPEAAQNSPYGGPVGKPGMTRRGKLVIGGAAVAAVTVLGIGGVHAVSAWQENQVREKEIELQLRLAEMQHEKDVIAAQEALAEADLSEVCVETEDGEHYEPVAACSAADVSQASDDLEDDQAAGEGGGSMAASGSVGVLIVIGAGVYLATRKKNPA